MALDRAGSLFSEDNAQIGGAAAEVLYAGSAPGLVAGAMQINVRIFEEAVPVIEGADFAIVAIQMGGQTASGRIYLSR
jgi:uncharacterized protein (TIGR03437 family)